MNLKPSALSVAMAASISLTACGPAQILGADDAVVKLSPLENNPSAGYLTLRGGAEDQKLVEVTSKQADRIELHETVKEGGLTKMQTLQEVNVPAGENVEFKPGGKHLMIWGVNKGAIEKGQMNLLVKYSNGEIFKVPAKIETMGSEQSMHSEIGTDKTAGHAMPSETMDTAPAE